MCRLCLYWITCGLHCNLDINPPHKSHPPYTLWSISSPIYIYFSRWDSKYCAERCPDTDLGVRAASLDLQVLTAVPSSSLAFYTKHTPINRSNADANTSKDLRETTNPYSGSTFSVWFWIECVLKTHFQSEICWIFMIVANQIGLHTSLK